MPSTRKMCTPESSVLRSILDLLAAERVLAFRLNVGATKIGRRFVVFGVRGMADVIAFPRGKVLFIECKSERGKQRPEQLSFQALVQSHGLDYIIARSSDDVLMWLLAHRGA